MMALPFLLSVAMVLAMSVTPVAAQPKEIVIGVIYPLSGPAALTGLENKAVNEIARDIANGDVDVALPFYQRLKGMPGLKGAKVRMIFADHQGKPEVGQAEAERLITQEKVHALYGSWHSSVTATVSQVAERYGIPHVNGQSSSPGLTKRGFKWFFRTSPHDEHFTQTMFDFFRDFQKKKGLTLKTLGITYEDTLFGADSGKVMRELAKKYNYEVVRRHAVPGPGHLAPGRDPAAEGGQPRRLDADVLPHGRDPVRAPEQGARLQPEDDHGPERRAPGTRLPQCGRQGGRGHDVAGALQHRPRRQAAGGQSVGRPLQAARTARTSTTTPPARSRACSPCSTPSTERARPTRKRSARRWSPPTFPGDQLVMTWDGIKFDETGQNIHVKGIIIQLQSLKWLTVYPFDIATTDVLYPIPAWKDRK